MKMVTVLSVVVLLLLAPPAVSQIPDDNLVVPGQRIGKWRLEMTIRELVQMNGPATLIEILTTQDGVPPLPRRHVWDPPGFAAITRDGQRVEFLLIGDARFKTEKNVGPGSTRAAVQSAYGTPTAETPVRPGRTRMIYDSIGFAVNVDGDPVVGVNVFRPGTGRSNWSF